MTEEDKKNERIKKDLKYYDARDKVTKKYSTEITEAFEEILPSDFWTEDNFEISIESILAEMYKELKPNE